MSTTPNENTFRIMFVVVFGTSIAVSAYHRFRARTGEPLARQEEGLVIIALIRSGGLVAVVSALCYAIDPEFLPWARLSLPTWVRWIGAVVGLLAPALLAWTLGHLGKNLTDTVVTRAKATLVTSGPYRWVRHPFYVAAALLFVSSFLLTTS